MSTGSFASAINAEIAQWMAANHPSVPVAWENGPAIDQDAVGPIWLDVQIVWQGGKSVTTGTRPRGRDYGVVRTTVYTRDGEGTAQTDEIVDGLRELLRSRRLGGAILDYPVRDRTTPPVLGWHRAALFTPFTLDSE